MAFVRWSSDRNRKCNDITPACGESVAALVEEEMQKSMSPALTSWSTCGSCPSWAPGYWSMSIVPLLNSLSLAENTSPTMPLARFGQARRCGLVPNDRGDELALRQAGLGSQWLSLISRRFFWQTPGNL